MTDSHDDVAVSTTPSHLAVFQHPDGPAALYLNGAIAFIGTDPADIYRRALEAAGVTLEESDRFLIGNTLAPDVTPEALFDAAAPTLAAIERFSSVQAQVRELREEAARLTAEADELERTLTASTDLGESPDPTEGAWPSDSLHEDSAEEPVADDDDDDDDDDDETQDDWTRFADPNAVDPLSPGFERPASSDVSA